MEESQRRQENISRYPLYKMLSWDLLFYYSIIFLFLTQVKNISPAMVFLTEAVYTISKIIIFIPCLTLIEKAGKRKSLIFANLCVTISIAILLLSKNLWQIFIFQIFSGIGYAIKGMCETNVLYDSLQDTEHRGDQFAQIDGKATSYYYYINAVTSFASGFLYIINPYIPIVLCFAICVISTIICTKFKDIHTKDRNNEEEIKPKEYIKGIDQSFRKIIKSPRLRYLILFGSLFYGLLAVLVSLRTSLLKDIKLPEQYFGIIFAILGIISGISTKNQERFHNKYRNRTLTVLSIPVIVSCVLIGLVTKIEMSFKLLISIIFILYLVQYIMKGPYYILIKKYINNFTTHKIRNRISSLYYLMENVIRTVLLLGVAGLMSITNTSNTFIIIGIIYAIVFGLLLRNMKTKVGLKPEEYEGRDIEFLKTK